MNTYVKAQFINAEIANVIASFPELQDDPLLLVDTLEGETDLFPFIATLLDHAEEAATMAEAIGIRVTAMNERQSRLNRRNEAARAVIRALMMHTGLDKISLPEATLSLAKGRKSVEVLNIDDLPQGFYQVERKADKKAIQSAFEAGETVPGAMLVTGKTSLTIRTK